MPPSCGGLLLPQPSKTYSIGPYSNDLTFSLADARHEWRSHWHLTEGSLHRVGKRYIPAVMNDAAAQALNHFFVTPSGVFGSAA